MSRSCGTCTKCCEGPLTGTVGGQKFYKGRPCHFVSVGVGCTIYEKRPLNPCQEYKCLWLTDISVPEWMKPEYVNAILDVRVIGEISYLRLTEAGETLPSKVLTWVLEYAISNGLNFAWTVNDGHHWIGSPEFTDAFNKQENKELSQ